MLGQEVQSSEHGTTGRVSNRMECCRKTGGETHLDTLWDIQRAFKLAVLEFLQGEEERALLGVIPCRGSVALARYGELAIPGHVDVYLRVLEARELKESGYMRRLPRFVYLHSTWGRAGTERVRGDVVMRGVVVYAPWFHDNLLRLSSVCSLAPLHHKDIALGELAVE